MSNYYYKGTSAPFYTIPISQMTILGNNTGLAPGYNDFPIQPAGNYTQNIPLPFGFLSNPVNPTNVSDSATAIYKTYTSKTTVNASTEAPGAKSIRILTVGGGGGGGGSGGYADVKAGNSNAIGNGGDGGQGGYGTYGYLKQTSLQNIFSGSNTGDEIQIYVGLGGAGGGNGKNNSANIPYGQEAVINGTPGLPGDGGKESYLVMGINSPNGYYANSSDPNAVNATGGNGGNGGSAKGNGNDGKTNSSPGSQGNTGSPNPADQIGNGDWNPDPIIGYGLPGTGSNHSSNNSTPGTDGCVQIIWLYD